MTTTAAKAGHSGEKEKEKTGIRRALGRGLESLLPGPRVVRPAAAPVEQGVPISPPFAKDAKDGPPGATGQTQVPRVARDDNPVGDTLAQAEAGTIQTVVDSDIAELRSARPDQRSGPTQVLDETITIQASAAGESRTTSNLVVQVLLGQIDANPYQTRNVFDDEMLGELAESIKAQGVVQPVVVRPGADGRYVLILGERRCRASKLAGKSSIPAIVRRVSEQQAAEMTIIENLQREDLNCMEQAKAFGLLSTEFKLTQEQIGRRVGLSRESVSNYMRLLRLPQTVIDYLAANQLAFSEARELMMLNDDKLIARAADIAVKKHLSIEKIEDLVMELQGLGPIRPEKKGGGARWVDPNVKAAQTELERLLGVRVRIRDRRGKGKIVIEYATVDDYERVVEALRGKQT